MDYFFYILLIILLVFLFDGDPDVWDKLHDKAMGVNSCEVKK